jgi:hypothetical protein
MKTRSIFLLVIILLIIQSDAIPASRCLKRRSVSEEFKDSTAVFAGLVVAEEYRPVSSKEDRLPEGGETLVVRFAVEQWWKGSGNEEVILYTGVTRYPGGLTRNFSEDFKFRVGKRYLVYASGLEDALRTNGCRRTAELEKAEEDLQKLGEAKLPEKRQASSLVTQPNNSFNRSGISLIVIVNLDAIRRFLPPG